MLGALMVKRRRSKRKRMVDYRMIFCQKLMTDLNNKAAASMTCAAL
jgi:hypothetical protein